jgi:hypothetical protein
MRVEEEERLLSPVFDVVRRGASSLESLPIVLVFVYGPELSGVREERIALCCF